MADEVSGSEEAILAAADEIRRRKAAEQAQVVTQATNTLKDAFAVPEVKTFIQALLDARGPLAGDNEIVYIANTLDRVAKRWPGN